MKAGFVYALVCFCFIGLVIFSNQPERLKSKGHRPGRRLVVRKLHPSSSSSTAASSKQSSTHETVAFDPIIASLERKREDRAWEKEFLKQQYKQWAEDSSMESSHDPAPHAESQPEPESEDWDFSDPEDYLNDEERFNISSRIITLFPLIDNHPSDGIISLQELVDWHYQAALSESEHRASRELEMYDKNHDGKVSLAEYLPHSSSANSNDSTEHGGAGWWKEQFDAADEDGDELLNGTEFKNFLHPQDSHNQKLHQWLRQQQIKDHDHDKDGKLSFEEFEQQVYDLIRSHDEESGHREDELDISARRESGAKRKFAELDQNKDRFLTEDELIPVMDALNPGELYFSKQQAEYLMSQADKNKDGHLTIEEMLENPYVFYSTAYAYEDYEHYHDEF